MIYKIHQDVRPYAWHLSFIGLVVGLLWAGIGFNVLHDYRAAEQGAANDTANLARTFDQDVTRMVESVDHTLLFVRQAYQHDRTGFIAGSWDFGHTFLDDLHVQMSLAGPDGKVLWSNLGALAVGVNAADRAHFQAQQQARDDALYIGSPVLARISGKTTIQFTRKLTAPDGSFDGIVTVSLDPSALSRFYDSISIGNGTITLITADGIVLARSPTGSALIGSRFPPDMQARLMRGTTSGAFRAVSGIDHVERILSARRLARYPLIVAVGLATEDVFAAYERNQRLYLAAGLVLSGVGIVAGMVILRQGKLMRDSRQALALTLENMSQGIAMVRADGTIAVLNQRAIDILGLPPDLLAGKPTFQDIIDWQLANHDFIAPEKWAPDPERVLLGTSGPYGDYNYERMRPDGTVLEVRTESMGDGGIVRTFTDITERKHTESALIAAQTRSAHAERMQALGQLAGGIAHDFNNILQAVQGGASLILTRAADADSVQRFAQMILDATERGTSITGRLLSFARRGELRAEPVEPEALLSGLRDVLSHTLGSGILVGVVLAPDLPPLLADKGQLETALVNLATNGRDAMPDGGSLTLTAAIEVVREGTDHAADLRPGRYIRLSVTDTGTGIDQPNLIRVLEPFFSTKPLGQGTGLGLSMAKGFAEQSGGGLSIVSGVPQDTVPLSAPPGTIHLSAPPGTVPLSAPHGTTVHLWLPAAVRTRTRTLAVEPVQPDMRRDNPGQCVLLVDDETMVRETLAMALEDFGYTVLAVANGAEALDLLVTAAVMVDVLVTDLSMPGIDGLELIRQAQRHRPGLPAVLLTGYAGLGAQLAVGDSVSGAFSLLSKPVTMAQLVDRIEALLAVAVAG